MAEFRLLRWHFLSFFNEFCETWRHVISYLQNVNDNKSLKFSNSLDANESIPVEVVKVESIVF